MTFNEFYAGYRGLPAKTKAIAKDHLRMAFNHGRKQNAAAIVVDPLLTSLPVSSQLEMQHHVWAAFEAGATNAPSL